MEEKKNNGNEDYTVMDEIIKKIREKKLKQMKELQQQKAAESEASVATRAELGEPAGELRAPVSPKGEPEARRAEVQREPFVMENWEEAKKRIELEKEFGLMMKREYKSPENRRNNNIIQKRMHTVIKNAIVSYVHSGMLPDPIEGIDLPGIIKHLNPTKEHLNDFIIKHLIEERFFDLTDPVQLKRYYDPRNLKFIRQARKKDSDEKPRVFKEKEPW